MSYPVFMVPAGDVLPVMFATFDGGTGASITMTGLAATDIEIYKDGSVTQRASDAGQVVHARGKHHGKPCSGHGSEQGLVS